MAGLAGAWMTRYDAVHSAEEVAPNGTAPRPAGSRRSRQCHDKGSVATMTPVEVCRPGEAAVRLWDATVMLSSEAGFFEFTRPPMNPPRL
jgi:hypothetical protein